MLGFKRERGIGWIVFSLSRNPSYQFPSNEQAGMMQLPQHAAGYQTKNCVIVSSGYLALDRTACSMLCMYGQFSLD